MGSGKASKFGGPKDPHMSKRKTAICGTPGNKLNPKDFYCACRWDYSKYGKSTKEAIAFLKKCKVRVVSGDKSIVVRVSDWGPGKSTKRIIDLSPGAMNELDISTDKEKVDVYLLYPYVE